jgi:hypothetical protein
MRVAQMYADTHHCSLQLDQYLFGLLFWVQLTCDSNSAPYCYKNRLCWFRTGQNLIDLDHFAGKIFYRVKT